MIAVIGGLADRFGCSLPIVGMDGEVRANV
jgi:hypothetical protein